MTIDEIRALVAQKIAGQGSAVDVGGGLPTILNAICDKLDAIPAPQVQSDWAQDDSAEVDYIKNKPLVPSTLQLPALPANGDSYEDVIAHGLTPAVIKAASEGKITHITVANSSKIYLITMATYTNDASCTIAFYEFFYDDTASIDSISGRYVQFAGPSTVYVTETDS